MAAAEQDANHCVCPAPQVPPRAAGQVRALRPAGGECRLLLPGPLGSPGLACARLEDASLTALASPSLYAGCAEAALIYGCDRGADCGWLSTVSVTKGRAYGAPGHPLALTHSCARHFVLRLLGLPRPVPRLLLRLVRWRAAVGALTATGRAELRQGQPLATRLLCLHLVTFGGEMFPILI